MAYYGPVPGRTDSIPVRDQRPRNNGYKSICTISWLVCQKKRSWIKGLGKNQQKEWNRSLFAVPSVRGHRTVTPWTPRNNCVYTRRAAQWHATCVVLIRPARHTRRIRNACLKVLRLSMGKILWVHTASDANWLKMYITRVFHYSTIFTETQFISFFYKENKYFIVRYFTK